MNYPKTLCLMFVEYVLNHICRSWVMLSKAVSHWVRIWLSFHAVAVPVPCTARGRQLSSARVRVPSHDLLSEDQTQVWQPGVFTQNLDNVKVYWNPLLKIGALSFWRTHGIFFFFSIIKTLSYTGGSQYSIFHKSVPSTELQTTPRSRNGSCIPEPNGIHDQKVLRSTELERHTWKSYSGFTCSQTLVPMPQVCSVGHAFRVQTV